MASHGTDWGAFGPGGGNVNPAASGGDPGAFAWNTISGSVGEHLQGGRQAAGTVLGGMGQGAVTGAMMGLGGGAPGVVAGAGVGAIVGGLLSGFTAIIDRARQLVETFNKLSAASRVLTEQYSQYSQSLATERGKWHEQDIRTNRRWAHAIENLAVDWSKWGREWNSTWSDFRIQIFKSTEPLMKDMLGFATTGSRLLGGVMENVTDVTRGYGIVYDAASTGIGKLARQGYFGQIGQVLANGVGEVTKNTPAMAAIKTLFNPLAMITGGPAAPFLAALGAAAKQRDQTEGEGMPWFDPNNTSVFRRLDTGKMQHTPVTVTLNVQNDAELALAMKRIHHSIKNAKTEERAYDIIRDSNWQRLTNSDMFTGTMSSLGESWR